MDINKPTNSWDARLYDEKMSFVSALGKGFLDWLQPEAGEVILDLGCGTGDLTREINASGAALLGIDLSSEMIERAQQKYPDIRFQVDNAETFRTTERFDAVFSNAALHWMKQPTAVITTIHSVLKPGGRFVAEFGGKGNVESIVRAITDVLHTDSVSAEERNPWYFPSIGEYAMLLEQQGFRVMRAIHFDRPTLLPDGNNGLKHWLDSFADSFFLGYSTAEKAAAYEQITEYVRSTLFRDDSWNADYKRIRIYAEKEA